MTDDELFELFRGLDVPRPLPDGVRRRITTELAAAPLSADRRDRLAASLEDGAAWSTLDAPRPLPAATRDRLAASLPAAPTWSARWPRLGLVAASTIAVIGIVAALTMSTADDGDLIAGPSSTTTLAPFGTVTIPGGASTGGSAGVLPPGGGAVTTTTIAFAPPTTAPLPGDGPATTRPPFDSPSAGGQGTSGGQTTSGPPPFTSPPASAPAPAPGPTTTTTSPGPTTTRPASDRYVVTIAGSGAARDGALAYFGLVNDRGGIDGRPVTVAESGGVALDFDDSVGNTRTQLASRTTVAADLTGPVFGTAGAADRLALLAVDLAIGDTALGQQVAVYREQAGVYSGAVADAVENRIRTRGGVVRSVVWDPAAPTVVGADVAIAVLDQSAASFAAALGDSTPADGIVGLGAFADPSLGLPDGFVVASPYRLASDDESETRSLAERVGTVTVDHVHGWQSAKLLAAALYVAGSDDPGAVAGALDRLDGAIAGFAPYARRSGTNVRTPDGGALRWTGSGFESEDFLDARD